MYKGFYNLTSAMLTHQHNLNVIGNNMVNISTSGYKQERYVATTFDDVMYSRVTVNESGGTEIGRQSYIRAASDIYTDYSQGVPEPTGLPLDFAINGDGFFAVADLETGDITLTRNGAFVKSELMRPSGEVDENGQDILERIYYLSDNEGRFVLSDTGGMIEVENEHEKMPVGIFDYMNYDGMEHVYDTYFRAVDKNGGIRQGEGTLMQGFLEMSNADLAEEMTKVIESQRAYGMALKMVQTSDEVETTINSLRG